MLSHFDATARDVNMYRGTKGTFELTAEVTAAEMYRARDFCNCEARLDARLYELDHSPRLPPQKAHGECPSELHDGVDQNFAWLDTADGDFLHCHWPPTFMNVRCFHS